MEIGFFQSDLFWENPEHNLSTFEEKLAALEQIPEIIFLPEMFNTGFSMKFKEPANYTTQKWMQLMADRHKTCIAGSYAVQISDKKFNRFLWAFPDKSLQHYDKRHLFSHGSENETFSTGTERKTINFGELSFLPQICYDLRFPVWSRNQPPYYDVIVYVASWPERRIENWKTLLKARAIENQAYVIGVNRLGTDGNDLSYNGQSTVISFDGQVILDAQDTDGYFSVNLSKTTLNAHREHYKFLSDQDHFNIS
jgi:omega-amidase